MNKTEIKITAKPRSEVYRHALLRSIARLEKKLEGRTRVVKLAEEMQEMRRYEDVVVGILLVCAVVYFLGQPW